MANTTSYAEIVRMAMKTRDNPTGEPITLKQLATLTGYSYEHCRKVFNSEPVGSRPFNDVLCGVLGLDPEAMWKLSQKDKVVHRLGAGFLSQIPTDKRLVSIWPQLSEPDQEKVIRVIEGLIITRQADIGPEKPAAPKKLKK